MATYFEEFKHRLPFIAMWTNICNVSLSGISVPLTNSQTEIYFHIKTSDREANNIPLVQYIEKNTIVQVMRNMKMIHIMLEANNSEEKDKEVELQEEMWTPKAAHTNPRKRKCYFKKPETPLQFCTSTKASLERKR